MADIFKIPKKMRGLFYAIIISILILLVGCSQGNLISAEPIDIGVVGEVSLPEYDNVTYTSISVEEILTNDIIKETFQLLVIDEDYLESVSEKEYIDAFYEKELTVLFMKSAKGHIPFMEPVTLDLPKTYHDYNDGPRKTIIITEYKKDSPLTYKSMDYSEETFIKEDFENIFRRFYNENR
ncbi:hypothetical protein [Psychrobacillus sp. FSL K6-1267]|uniref:hypothetical protein n=1 Tax=Psychrobacillus sp. FSL K6-1267 TaxID=2921543 RepID=UPI0030FCD7C6